ncbi:hypothetical protein [Aureimonas endophytica]|nr:hypothetical protein [Aureimonas endophytica]
MPDHRKIVLNSGRVHQIERLSELRKTSLAGAVETLVADRVKAGEIPPGFPAFKIARENERLVIVLDGHELSPVAPDAASKFGAELVVLAGRPAGSASLDLGDENVLVARCSGYGFTISAGGARLTVSRSMLAEIGEQILEAAR